MIGEESVIGGASYDNAGRALRSTRTRHNRSERPFERCPSLARRLIRALLAERGGCVSLESVSDLALDVHLSIPSQGRGHHARRLLAVGELDGEIGRVRLGDLGVLVLTDVGHGGLVDLVRRRFEQNRRRVKAVAVRIGGQVNSGAPVKAPTRLQSGQWIGEAAAPAVRGTSVRTRGAASRADPPTFADIQGRRALRMRVDIA